MKTVARINERLLRTRCRYKYCAWMFSFMLPTAPGDTCNGHAHFTDEESQLQRGESLVQGHTPGGRWRQRSEQAVWRQAPRLCPVLSTAPSLSTRGGMGAAASTATPGSAGRVQGAGTVLWRGRFALHFGNPGAAFSLCDQLNCLSGSGRRASEEASGTAGLPAEDHSQQAAFSYLGRRWTLSMPSFTLAV